MTQRYGTVRMAAGRTQHTYVKRAIPDGTSLFKNKDALSEPAPDDHPHFLKYATELAKSLRHIILIDQVRLTCAPAQRGANTVQVVYPSSDKQDILHLLEEHITENIVKVLPKLTIKIFRD